MATQTTTHAETSVPDTAHADASGALFKLDPGLMIWTWITFGCLLFILTKFGWKPILGALKEREKTIQDSLDNARRIKEEMESISAQQKEMLQKAKLEAEEFLKQEKEKANQSIQTLIEKANRSATAIIEEAKIQVDEEMRGAKARLQGEVTHLVVEVTKKILKESLDETRHQKLVSEFIQDLK